MQITETGYYETRDGGLAWVYPRTPFTIAEHNNPIDGYVRHGDQWEFKTWLENGQESNDQTNDKDLIRYIGKELPEEKPQPHFTVPVLETKTAFYKADKPERVELSKLWVGWFESDKGGIYRGASFPDKITARTEADNVTFKTLAITPADAVSFTIGEGLEQLKWGIYQVYCY